MSQHYFTIGPMYLVFRVVAFQRIKRQCTRVAVKENTGESSKSDLSKMATIHTFSSANSKFIFLVYYMRGWIFRCPEDGNLPLRPWQPCLWGASPCPWPSCPWGAAPCPWGAVVWCIDSGSSFQNVFRTLGLGFK